MDVQNIWVMNADGSNATPLTQLSTLGGLSRFPSWSPDESKIIFYSDRNLDGSNNGSLYLIYNLWIMNADGSDLTHLTDFTTNASLRYPVWAPDGSFIAFESDLNLTSASDSDPVNNAINIWAIKPDKSDLRSITQSTTSGADSSSIVFTADSDTIFFQSARNLDKSNTGSVNPNNNIWKVGSDGLNLNPVTTISASGVDSRDPRL